MGLQSEIYNFFNEARPRTKSAGVEDIERTGTGRKQRDFDFDSGYKEIVVKKYEITTITDKGVEKNTTLPPFEILQIIKLNPDNKDIKFEDIKVGEKYKYSKKTPGGAEKKGEIILKSKTPKETAVNTDPQKKTRFSDTNVNPEGLKSYYLKSPGAVHEISFNNITQGVKQRVYTIYRTITDQEYKTLVKNVNSKVSTYVEPSDESNHYKDVYYITIPKVKYGTRAGADYIYFVWIKDDKIKKLTSEQKDKIKLVLVPIKDIAEGITIRPLTYETLKDFLSDNNKEKLKKTKPKDTPKYNDEAEILDIDLSLLIDDEDFEDAPEEKPEDSPEVKASKQQAAEFMLDDKVDRIFIQIIKNYDTTRNTTATSTEKQEAKEKLSNPQTGLLKRFLDSLFDFTNNPQDRKAVIDYNVKNKLQQKPGLHTMIKTSYDNMESLKENYMIKEEISKQEYFLVPTNTEKGELLKKVFTSNANFKKINYEGEEGFVKTFDADQIEKIEKTSGDGLKPIVVYKGEKTASPKAAPEEKQYKVGTVIDGGKENINVISGNKILKLIRINPQNKDIAFEDLEANKPYEFVEKLSVGPARKGVITIKSLSPVGEKGKRTEFITIDNKEKEKSAKKEKPEMKSVKQMGKWMSVPVNMGVKMADVKPSQLRFKFYVVNTEKKEIVKGFDNWGDAKKAAQDMGPKFKAMQRAEITSAGINESLSKEDIAKLKSTRVSFTIQSRLKADEQYNVSDTVKKVKEEKGNIIIELSQAGTVTFDKEGTGKFFYKEDEEYYQTLNVPQATLDIIKKALAPSKDTKEPEPKLEAYIRKRVRQAIKEAEVSQYWGYQGRDVKKKRLEEYLKRYEWGFQDSDNPYTHSNGSAIHAIVSKLVHELAAMGVNAIAIFNSYAPEGYQVSDLNQLDYASDSPLGSQLTQPYNPDSLTARGGRVAEEDGKVTSIAQNYMNQLNDKYGDKGIEDLAKGYNDKDRIIMGSDAVKKVVQKAIQKSYGKDAAKAGLELKKAFMAISDEDLKNNP